MSRYSLRKLNDTETEELVFDFCKHEGIDPEKDTTAHINGLGNIRCQEWQRLAIEELIEVKLFMFWKHQHPLVTH